MLDLEELALRDGKAADLPGVTNYDEVKCHHLVSTYPRGNRPAIHIVDVLFWEIPVFFLPGHLDGIRVLGELDNSKLSAMRDLDPVFLRIEPDKWPAVAVADERSPYRVERGCFHGYTSIK